MTNPVETVTVGGEDGPVRIDRWFKRHYPALAHGRLEKLLRTGQIRVDGKRAKSGDRLMPGQAIRVPLDAEPSPAAPTAPRQLLPADEAMLRNAILHQDEAVIVLNKPPGLAVQGGTRSERHLDGLLDALRFGHAERPKLVHRLDKDTSGVLVIARSVVAAAFLTRAFRERTTRKDLLGAGGRCPETAARADRSGARQALRPGWRTRPCQPRRGQARGHLLPRRRQRGRTGELACPAAGHRAHAPAARPLRRDRRPAPRRRQIRRRCHAYRRTAGRAAASSACALSLDPASAWRNSEDSRTAAVAHAAELGVLWLFRRCRGSIFRTGSAGMKRFYQQTGIVSAAGGYGVALDGKPIKTPAKQPLIVPSAALADAIAAEWEAQQGEIRPAQMPLTRLASTAIDRVEPAARSNRRADRRLRRDRSGLLPGGTSAGAGNTPACGVAAAGRLGGAALRRSA